MFFSPAPAQPLPLAELHMHIEGSLEPEMLLRLARRNAVSLPTEDLETLRGRYKFDELQSFLNLYYESMRVLRTERDYTELADAYLERAARAGVVRAEIFFDPQTHLENGIPLDVVFNGLSASLDSARERFGVSADLILCVERHRGPEAAERVLREALEFRDRFIGLGMDSAEVGYPPAPFKPVYDIARAEGLHLVAHAGEEAGPDYIWQALDVLGVERIDHGVRALEDPALVDRLVAEQIPLTVCPLSNVSLKVFRELGHHTLPEMIGRGLMVTINSDDPAYFGGYLDDNFAALRGELGIDEETVARLAENSIRASFAPEAEKAGWLAQIAAARGADA